MDAALTLERFLSRRPVSFKAASGPPSLNGAFLDIDDESGLAREIRLIRLDTPDHISARSDRQEMHSATA